MGDDERVRKLIESLIEEEIQNTAEEALGSVLRGNNALSKLEGAYVKRRGKEWLKSTLGTVLQEVITDCAFYEVDPSRVEIMLGPKASSEEVEVVCEVGKEAVLKLANSILKAVCSKESVESLPTTMRRFARRTYIASHERGVEDPLAVAGGFLWLRVLSPALTSPGSAGILGDKPPILHENTRRRVLLATKLIQNASNNIEFGKKEPFMLCFNEFVRKASDDIRDFLEAVCMTEDETTESTEVELFCSSESQEFTELNVDTLLSLHRICVSVGDKWLASMTKKGILGRFGTRLSKILGQLGPAPPRRMNFADIDKGSSSSSASTGRLERSETVSIEHTEDAQALYWGEAREGVVNQLYVIARRLRQELVLAPNTLINAVLKKLEEGDCTSKSYDVVFDMTFFTPTQNLRAIYSVGTALYKSLPHEYRKNLHYAIVLHPDRNTRALIQFAQALASQKGNQKLHLCFSWQDLGRWITDIDIPEESKTNVLESMSVVKINAAGKRQERLVKLTPRSLLNIDPKGPRVQNERAIGLIDRIDLRGEKTVCLHFVDPELARQKDWNEQTVEQFAEKMIQNNSFSDGGGNVFTKLRSKVKEYTVSEQDAMERVYEFVNTSKRDEFVLDILRLGWRIQEKKNSNVLPHFFLIKKTGAVGQNQLRVWLLTTDSILNLDTTLKLHSEIGLASIVWVKPDPERSDVVLLRVLDRDDPIAVRTDWRDSLVAAIADALPNAAFSNEQVDVDIHDLTESGTGQQQQVQASGKGSWRKGGGEKSGEGLSLRDSGARQRGRVVQSRSKSETPEPRSPLRISGWDTDLSMSSEQVVLSPPSPRGRSSHVSEASSRRSEGEGSASPRSRRGDISPRTRAGVGEKPASPTFGLRRGNSKVLLTYSDDSTAASPVAMGNRRQKHHAEQSASREKKSE